MKRTKRNGITVHQYVTDVEAITVRDLEGEGSQAEILVKTKYGDLVLRLIGTRNRIIRLTDLRRRDRHQRRKQAMVSIPFEAVAGRAS